MEQQNIVSNKVEASEQAVETIQKHRRHKKPKAEEVVGLPGINMSELKPSIIGDIYPTEINIPLDSPIGNPAEAASCHEFAAGLDLQAKAKGVGHVASIRFTESNCEVILMNQVASKPVKTIDPAINTFTQLKDFLDAATLLKANPTGKPSTYKVKVNGTTLVERRF